MPEHHGEELRPATHDEMFDNPAYALRFCGRKRVHDADDALARIAAERLVEHMLQSRFVVMKRPPSALPTDLACRAWL